MKVKILRRENPFSESYWQTFDHEPEKDETVANLLDRLNYKDDIRDENGNPASRISWENSCNQGVCGACAMVINGLPRLACETFLRDLKGDFITIEPLSKFPVISDLLVDRSIIQENLLNSGVYVHGNASVASSKHEDLYAAAKCLKCGLCMEICPNYVSGKKFYGAGFSNECFLAAELSTEDSNDLTKEHARHFSSGCSKSLSCMDVCPKNNDSFSFMNFAGKKR